MIGRSVIVAIALSAASSVTAQVPPCGPHTAVLALAGARYVAVIVALAADADG